MAKEFGVPYNIKIFVFGLVISLLLITSGVLLLVIVRTREEFFILKVSIIALLSYFALFIIYLIGSATLMKYMVGEEGILVKSLLLKEFIPYEWIKDVTISKAIKEDIKDILYSGLVYGALPLNKQEVVFFYGVKNINEVVILTLTDDTKVVLTPKDVKNFVKELNSYIEKFNKELPKVSASLGLAAFSLALSFFIALVLPILKEIMKGRVPSLPIITVQAIISFLLAITVALVSVPLVFFSFTRYSYRNKLVAYFVMSLTPFITLVLSSIVATFF